jgi:hypothetical protein
MLEHKKKLTISSFLDIEKFRKLYRSHRNSLDQEAGYLAQQEAYNDSAFGLDGFDEMLNDVEIGRE